MRRLVTDLKNSREIEPVNTVSGSMTNGESVLNGLMARLETLKLLITTPERYRYE